MTLPRERTLAVQHVKAFLCRLAHRPIVGGYTGIPKAVREEAARLLRHYPNDYELVVASEQAPTVFGKPDQVTSPGPRFTHGQD